MSKPPLWLPDGSVRAILAVVSLLFAGGAVLLRIDLPDWFIGIVSGALMSYFAMRSPAKN